MPAPGTRSVTASDYRLRDVWPRRRRVRLLPPGQRVSRAMPRFSTRPLVPPPSAPADDVLVVNGGVGTDIGIGRDRLEALERVDMVAHFHCVTNWTVLDLRRSGWRLRDVLGDPSQAARTRSVAIGTPTHNDTRRRMPGVGDGALDPTLCASRSGSALPSSVGGSPVSCREGVPSCTQLQPVPLR